MIYLFSIGFLDISWVDMIDITLVSILLYQVYKLMRGSVAVKIFLGVLALYLIYLIVRAAQMELLGSILGQFMGYGVLAAIILFQPEIRKFLLLIGKSADFKSLDGIRSFFNWKRSRKEETFNITPVIEAVKILGGTNTGALIVFSRDSALKFYSESGDIIDAVLSKRLLVSIFNKNSPLHDGAVIVYKGKIKAARCVLPVSESDSLPAQFGLRHRAALGMSEVTDTTVLVVSEESGQFSLARNGRLEHNLSPQELRKGINEYLTAEKETAMETMAENSTETSVVAKEANAGA
ncbi:diadenylate cyclase CdaA [Fulvivirga sedimenti]|uniref:Diadenylate cyclase n=1 Tax=Fulvivirga sedimenti TaxID=2879465 RepID=A0A9X1HUA7_9BACT|nr:diadenylate cyclase CdaA [Fulvivirga sedimenti]MCA6078060.1 diadenylate cyclase CdaA [Fulvivirga sedimenti]